MANSELLRLMVIFLGQKRRGNAIKSINIDQFDAQIEYKMIKIYCFHVNLNTSVTDEDQEMQLKALEKQITHICVYLRMKGKTNHSSYRYFCHIEI